MQTTSPKSYLNLQTEPAFLSHKKYIKSHQNQESGVQKNLSDCCYSISNLALIIACIVAIIFLAKFFQDDLLYYYGEHIFSLRFYRQLIFIIVVVPLTLLVPLFNAASAFFLYGRDKSELGTSLIRVKIFYQIIVAILIFIALVFIAPSIRFTNLATQIELELRMHMKMRYENPFSYEFLDKLQANFECCDILWYRANYMDKLPMSCYVPDGTYSIFFNVTCSEAVGYTVSNWCAIIAACLVAILVSLAILLGIDILNLLAYSSGQYDIGAQEARIGSNGGSSTSLNSNQPTGLNNRRSGNDDEDDDDDDDDILSSDIARRLRLSEAERERERERAALGAPLLSRNGSQQTDETNPKRRSSSISSNTTTPLMTRSHYLHNRPQSPVFLDAPILNKNTSNTSLGPQGADCQTPIKGVLRKTSSFQRVDSDNDVGTIDSEDAISLHEHNRRLQREIQSRRSILNVRFAN